MNLIKYIMTMGIDTSGDIDLKRIENVFNKGLPPISSLYVIHTSDDPKNTGEIFGIPLHFHRIQNQFDHLEVIKAIINIYRMSDVKNQFYIDITGGTKPMSLGAFLGGSYIGATIIYIPMGSKGFQEITPPTIPPLKLTKVQKFILTHMDDDRNDKMKRGDVNIGTSQSDIFSGVKQKIKNISVQVISYNCKVLRGSGYLTTLPDKEDNRRKIYSLTGQGIMACQLTK